MPVIRCSNEVYKALQDKALQRGEPISIVLDRLIYGLDTITPKQLPKDKPKPKAKANPEPKVELPELVKKARKWTKSFGGKRAKCGKCGKHILVKNKAQHEATCED